MKHEGRKELERRCRDIIDRVFGTIMDESHEKILTNNFFSTDTILELKVGITILTFKAAY